MTDTAETKTEQDDNQDYFDRIADYGLTPLWQQFKSLMSPEPKVKSVPHCWHYAKIRKFLVEASTMITSEDAERRVLLLENPGIPGTNQITETLLSGVQMILPGEVAPSHRHIPSDARLILEGVDGAFTTVNGERLQMDFGDFIITPNWTWHDHGHHGDKPVVWQDILDTPLANAIGPMFLENYPDTVHPRGQPDDDTLHRYGANMRAIGITPETNLFSPLLRYTYTSSRAAAEALALTDEPDPHFGVKMEYINPTTGGTAMATITVCLQRLPASFETRPYQSTEGFILTCIEGGGQVSIGEGEDRLIFKFSERDIIVIPCWYPFSVKANADTYLFVSSDKIVQTKLGYWRELKH
ncbi:MAG: gentisate 1,2-dioxygenase [Planctomycetota bacterium]|jgi:gentisate 1,2-dioxygenase